MTALREALIEVVRAHGLTHFDEPVALASGEMSRDFIDGKAALANGTDLRTACDVMLAELGGIDFEAVGGLTMGADQFAHGIALVANRRWFVVRKEPKGRGTNKLVEGAEIGAGTRVFLVDDVVTTGGSIQKAFKAVTDLGATVVAAATLVDRGEVAKRFFEKVDVPYFPVVTYRDLGIEPVGGGLVNA